mgnify:CR=1 FL=1
MHQEYLFKMVRQKTKELLNGYIRNNMILEQMEHYIVAPKLGENPELIARVCVISDGYS